MIRDGRDVAASFVAQKFGPTEIFASLRQWETRTLRMRQAELACAPSWIGTSFAQIERQTGSRIVVVNRYGEGFIPSSGSIYQEDDIIHTAVLATDLDRVRSIATDAPQESA